RASKQLTVASRHVGAAGPGAPVSYCVAAAALGVYSFAGGRLPEEAGLFFGDTSGITKGGSSGCLFSRLTLFVAYRIAFIRFESAIWGLHASAAECRARRRGWGGAEHVQRRCLQLCVRSILRHCLECVGHAPRAAGV